jgi:glucose-1-phosphate cytidylyltransferase
MAILCRADGSHLCQRARHYANAAGPGALAAWAPKPLSLHLFGSAGMVRKAVILAGGMGTRLAEETGLRPKPMVEIGGRPILWHIMKIYAAHGITEFIVCLGYKGEMIKDYFALYHLHRADVTFDIAANTTTIHRQSVEPWRVTLIDTGTDSMTGGRLKRVRDWVGDETFCMTYGDAVSTVDITKLLAFHAAHGRAATVTAVRPPARFGALKIEDGAVRSFQEKPRGDGDWINGGFFVLNPSCLDLIAGDGTVWEAEPLEALAARGELMAFEHDGFWQPMDTLRDKRVLEQLWASGKPPWLQAP